MPDLFDVYRYFQSVWEENYPEWLDQARNAWQNSPVPSHQDLTLIDYRHGNFILSSAVQVIEATQDVKLVGESLALVEESVAQATESPPIPGRDPPARFPAGYFGWSENPHVSALSEYQWGVGAMRLLESILTGRAPATPHEKETALRLAEWIEHNIIEKWFVVAEIRYFLNRMATGAVHNLPSLRTGHWSSKIWIAIHLGFMARRVLGNSSLFDHNPSRTPDDWWSDFWRSRYTVIEGDGALQYDLDNPDIRNRATPPYHYLDSIHANRLGRLVSYAEFAGDQFQCRHKALAISKTVTKRIWNGRTGDEILTNNYITGETGHDVHGSVHPVSGIEGWGWVYNGWGELFWDEEIDMILAELLALVRRGGNRSATEVRHATEFGKIGLCGALLWNPYARRRAAEAVA